RAELVEDLSGRAPEQEPTRSEQDLVLDRGLAEAQQRLPARARGGEVLGPVGGKLEVDVRILPREQRGLEHPRIPGMAHHDLKLREVSRDRVEMSRVAEVAHA